MAVNWTNWTKSSVQFKSSFLGELWTERSSFFYQRTWTWTEVRFFDELELNASQIFSSFKPGFLCTAGQKISKSTGQKNSWNQINQFHNCFFPQKIKYYFQKFREIYYLTWVVCWPGLFQILIPTVLHKTNENEL